LRTRGQLLVEQACERVQVESVRPKRCGECSNAAAESFQREARKGENAKW